jgi:predicted ArsR family transcriptional regulator
VNDSIDRLAPLVEPAHRRVFESVASADSPVTREQVAVGSGLSLALATFHLERLLEAGLLESNSAVVAGPVSPAGTGGGKRRGRPAKLYRVARREFTVSVPGRDYRLAAEIFAEALVGELPPALDEAARERGRVMGRGVSDRRKLLDALADHGYEPRPSDGDSIALRNCPFDGLTERHRDLICPTNLALLEGLIEGAAGTTGMEALLEPGEGRCCVVLRPLDR